jgi:hypothetical protein
MPVHVSIRPVRFLLLATVGLLVAPAIAQTPDVVFLGTDPVTFASIPVAAADISSLDVDADGNQYYADSSDGTVIEVDTSGAQSTLARGLNLPLIAVDFRGNVFIADTGNNRVLKVTNGPVRSTSELALAAALNAIAVDSADNVFYISGNAVVEIQHSGTPALVASVPGASLLAFGPAANGASHLYIVDKQGSTYRAYLYSYNGGTAGTLSGPVMGFLPAVQSGSTINSFAVDPHGNAVVVAVNGGTAQVTLGALNGFEKTIYTSKVATTPIAEDANGSIYFLDGPGLEQIQLGAVNYGEADEVDHGAPGKTLTLNFGAPANATFTPSSPSSGQFFLPYVYDPSDLQSATTLPIYFGPEDSGLVTGTLTLTDQNNRKLDVPLYGTADVPYEAFYVPAMNLSKQPPSTSKPVDMVVIPSCDTLDPLSPCGASYILDAASGEVTESPAFSGVRRVIVSGLKNPQKLSVDPDGNVYVTQGGVPGLLHVAANGSKTQLATDLANPIGVALDGAHNLYVTNGDDIVRVAPDGTEALFATPDSDGGFKSALSLAMDFQGNLYAGFASNPDYNRGAILKFTPAGVAQALHVNVLDPAGLFAARNSVLFFTDRGRGTVYVYSSNAIQKSLAFGLKEPVAIATDIAGDLSVVDSGLGAVLSVAGEPYQYIPPFGRVPVGSSKTITLTVVTVGTAPSPSSSGIDVRPQSCNPDFLPAQEITYPGDRGTLLNVPFTFQPKIVGPVTCEVDIFDNNDWLSEYPAVFELSGTGVAAPGSASFALTPPYKPVVGQPLTIQVSALKPDLSLNTSLNGTVTVAYSGASSARFSIALTNGTGSFNFTALATSIYTFVISGGGVNSTVNMNFGAARTQITVSGKFVAGATGPVLSAKINVTGQFGLVPVGLVLLALDSGSEYIIELTNGEGSFTSGPLTSLGTGSHTLEAVFVGNPNFVGSHRTITLSYNPGP